MSVSTTADAVPGRGEPEFGAELLAIFGRRRWVVLATMAVITGLAVLFALTWPPVYRATAQLVVLTDGADARTGADIAPSASQDEGRIANQVQLLTARPLARRIVDDLGLVDDLEFNPAARPAARLTAGQRRAAHEAATDRLRDMVAVRRVGRSAVILVTVESRSPAKAAKIANKYVATHIALQRDDQRTSAASTAALLARKVETLRGQVIADERAVADYRRRNNLAAGPAVADSGRLDRLADALVEARTKRSEAAARAAGAGAWTGVTRTATSPLLNDLRRQSAELGRRSAELAAFYGPGYPELQRVKAELADVERRIGEESARVARELGAEVAVEAAREGQLRSDVASVRAEGSAQRVASVRLMDLERTAEASRTQYVALLARLGQLGSDAELSRVPVRLLARAVVPDAPALPRRNEIIVVALVGSFVLGLILAYAIDRLRDRVVRSGAQVERLTGLPTLAMIPETKSQDGVPAHHRLASEPRSLYAEALRGLFLELTERLPRRRSQMVLVTSPLPGDGKTTVALGIAAAAAGLHRRAVVIDLDLRRPGLAAVGGWDPARPDLTQWLAGTVGLDDVLAPDPVIPGLLMIGVATPAADPAGMLSAARMQQLLDKLRDRFDLVVVNGPPVLAVRDAKTVSGAVTATLLVTRWNRTRDDVLCAAVRALGGPLAGVAINRVDLARHASGAPGVDAVRYYRECAAYFAAPASRRAA